MSRKNVLDSAYDKITHSNSILNLKSIFHRWRPDRSIAQSVVIENPNTLNNKCKIKKSDSGVKRKTSINSISSLHTIVDLTSNFKKEANYETLECSSQEESEDRLNYFTCSPGQFSQVNDGNERLGNSNLLAITNANNNVYNNQEPTCCNKNLLNSQEPNCCNNGNTPFKNQEPYSRQLTCNTLFNNKERTFCTANNANNIHNGQEQSSCTLNCSNNLYNNHEQNCSKINIGNNLYDNQTEICFKENNINNLYTNREEKFRTIDSEKNLYNNESNCCTSYNRDQQKKTCTIFDDQKKTCTIFDDQQNQSGRSLYGEVGKSGLRHRGTQHGSGLVRSAHRKVTQTFY